MRGMTLIEVVLFIIIVSVGLAGVLSAFNIATQASADPMLRKQALALAEGMLEEVLLKNFADVLDECTLTTTPRCQPNTPTDRGNYNDVSDYDTWDQTGVKSLSDSSAITGLENYKVEVAVVAGTFPAPDTTPAMLITVTVTKGSEVITLTGYRTNYE